MTVAIANKHFVLRYVAAFNSADFETLRHVFAEDSIIQGIPGQGGLEIALLRDGRIQERWAARDAFTLARQVGLLFQ